MNITAILKKNAIKKTLARTAILDILKKAKKPIDAGEIIEKLKSMKIKIDRATVFRNINLMVKKRLINKINFNEGKYRYEIVFLPHHHHLVCTQCGCISNIKSNSLYKEIKKISKMVNNLHNFQIEEHRVEFFGKCKTCKDKFLLS